MRSSFTKDMSSTITDFIVAEREQLRWRKGWVRLLQGIIKKMIQLSTPASNLRRILQICREEKRKLKVLHYIYLARYHNSFEQFRELIEIYFFSECVIPDEKNYKVKASRISQSFTAPGITRFFNNPVLSQLPEKIYHELIAAN